MDQTLATKAQKALADLLPTSEIETITLYFNKLVKKINESKTSYFAIVIALSFVRAFMGKGSVSKEAFINTQQAEHQMLELLIKDLNEYMTEVKLQVRQMAE